MKRRSLFVILVFVTACSADNSVEPTTGKDYLAAMLSAITKNSAYATTFDWNAYRTGLETTAGSSLGVDEAMGYVKQALQKVNDPHSWFNSYGYGFKTNPDDPECNGVAETTVPTIPNIGFIKITGSFVGAEDVYQKSIKDQDNKEIKGWIVDLRGIPANEIWPMLAGIGPILGDGIAGYYFTATSEKTFGYQSGKAMENGTTAKITVATPYTLINKNPKVAVLINNGTTTAGEALVIAFKGRANTKFFGKATCGRPGSIKSISIGEYQSEIALTTELVADRDKNKQLSPVTPDVEVVTNTSEIYEKAAAWINEN